MHPPPFSTSPFGTPSHTLHAAVVAGRGRSRVNSTLTAHNKNKMTRARRVPRKEFKLSSFIYRQTPKNTVEGQSTRGDYVVFLRVAPQDPPALNLKTCPTKRQQQQHLRLLFPRSPLPFNTLGNQRKPFVFVINSLIREREPFPFHFSFPIPLSSFPTCCIIVALQLPSSHREFTQINHQ